MTAHVDAPYGVLGPGAGRLLAHVNSPQDLRRVAPDQLPVLCAEIRAALVETLTRTGGHLGPNLGVVELTLALHRVFDSPRDVLVWDTGHQSYVHKIVTGRGPALSGLRQQGGISGYPCRAESSHDRIENSHASTALSYGDGLAKAFALRGESDRAVVVVVGDGALTGGMCWEALNAIGSAPRPVIVVLNDNGRSYAPTVGSFAGVLAEVRAGNRGAGNPAAAFFRRLGLEYLGPVDGHDVAQVEFALEQARALDRPVVVHCLTEKGRGHRPAELDEVDRMHAVSAQPGALPGATIRPSWTAVFEAELARAVRDRDDVVAVTAAMLAPTGLGAARDDSPDRVYDVGIAEQHAVTSAAGMAMGGLHPVVALYATFLNRAFDQVLMDVGLHALPVTFVLDRAGVTGSDGPSHHGMWDLAVLGLVPGMRVAAPRDAVRLRELFGEALADRTGPTALRFPKGEVEAEVRTVARVGSADVLRAGARPDILILAVGPLAGPAVLAAHELALEGIEVTVIDPRWALPVDPALITEVRRYDEVLTVEDHGSAGGFGDALARAMRTNGVRVPLTTLGLRQEFLAHGERSELLADQGLDGAGIAATIRRAFRRRTARAQPNLRASAR